MTEHQSAYDILGGDHEDVSDVLEALPTPESAADILGEGPVIPFGTHLPDFGTHTPEFGDEILGDVDVRHTGQDALSILDSSTAGPSFGVGTPNGEDPEFGTHAPDFGVLGHSSEFGTHEPDFGTHLPEFLDGDIDVRHTGPDALTILDEPSAGPDFGVGTPDGTGPEFGTEENDFGVLGEDAPPGADEVVEDRPLLNFGGDVPDATTDEEFDFGDEIPGTTEITGLPGDVAFDFALLGADDEQSSDGDVVENRPVLDFGGDIPDATDEEEFDFFGDEIPGTTEVTGDDDAASSSADAPHGDDEVVEDRPLLNYGGDVPDATDDEEFDFGDDVPGTTEISGIPADIAFDIAMMKADKDDDSVGESASVDERAGIDYDTLRDATDTPIMVDRVAPDLLREWSLDFGPVWAPAGEQTTITISPQCLFRSEKIIATDSNGGLDTRIIQVAVGNKLQRPGAGGQGTSTQFFAQSALANGIKFDTAQRWSRVAVTVSFINASTFDMSVFGRAVVER